MGGSSVYIVCSLERAYKMVNPIVETICETANIKVEVWDVNGTSHWKLTNPSTGHEKVIVGAYEFADLLLGTTYGVPTHGAK